MSILQDYEKLRKKLGDKKYEAIENILKFMVKLMNGIKE